MDESNDNTLQRLARHKWATASLLVICGLIGGIWYFLANYIVVTLSVSVPLSVKIADVTALANYGASSQNIKPNGTAIIPRKTTNLTIATSNQQIATTTSLSAPWYGFTSKKVTLHSDYNADKISYRSTLGDPCATYDQSHDRLLAYQCTGDSALVHYNTSGSQWNIESIAPVSSTGTVMPYHGGVLTITLQADAGPSLTYIAPDGTSHYYDLPAGFNYNNMYQMSLVTNPTDTTDSRFIIVADNGTIYLGSVTGDSDTSYVTVAPPEKYDSMANQTFCSFRKEQSYCYIGTRDSDSEPSKKPVAAQKILKVSFTSSKTESYGANTPILNNFYVTNDGTLFGRQFKIISYLKLTGNTYTAQEVTSNADAAETSDKLYFVNQGGLSAYDTKTGDSYQVFRSPNIKPSHIIATDSKLFITGKSVNSDSYTYAWKITNDIDNNYGSRLIDLLPSFPVTGAYGTTDLVGTTINIDPLAGSATSAADIRQKKQDTLEYLRLLGVDTNHITLSNP